MQSYLWQPSIESMNSSRMMEFIGFVNNRYDLTIQDYSQLYSYNKS